MGIPTKGAIYLEILSTYLSLKGNLFYTFLKANKIGADISGVITMNPYYLCLIDPILDIEDLDKLAMFYDIDMSLPDVEKARNMAYMHNFMLDESNIVIGNSTSIPYVTLVEKANSGYILSKRSYDTLIATGMLLKREDVTAIRYLLNPDVKEENFKLPVEGWKFQNLKYVLKTSKDSRDMVNTYIDSGLGVKVVLNGIAYVSDFVYASKEMYIYDKAHKMFKANTAIELSRDEIKMIIDDFEKIKAKQLGLPEGGFKLETKQAESLNILGNPLICLTGPAGSGKTTTVELLVYAAERLLKLESKKIAFTAPTGRAASRLAEVVQRKTLTINSLFGLGIGVDNSIIPDGDEIPIDYELVIIDESSMPNLNTMYSMFKGLADKTRVYFLGDIEQLPPIGPGKPFATLLSFLPTIALNVNKRASANSGITRNAEKILYESDGIVSDLENTHDFRIINTKDINTVVQATLNVCKYHLGLAPAQGYIPISSLPQGMNPDDIQVISPVNKHAWGTVAMNKALQDIFNPKRNGLRIINFNKRFNESIEFRMGDRVMHVKSNQKDRLRFIQLDYGKFVLAKNKGISNGDIGKIVGVYPYEKLDFSEVTSITEKEAIEKTITGGEQTLYMAVNYKDTDLVTGKPMEFTVLYRMEEVANSGQWSDVTSKDLNYLDLAYASTVHKLQGSEAKLVITLMLPAGRGNFISRNMIYTAETRARVGEYFIGDVLGKDSTVNKGRKIKQTEQIGVLLDNMI